MCDNSQDRIDSYLRGMMSKADRQRFESDIESDLTLYNDFSATKEIADVIIDRGRKLDMINIWEEEAKRERTKHKKKYIQNWVIGLSAVACISFGFFFLKPLIFPSISNKAFEMPYFSQEQYLYGENTGVDVLDSMINSKDFDNALAFADILISENKQHVENTNQKDDTNKDYDIVNYGSLDSISSINSDRIKRYEEIVYIVEWRRIHLLLALGKKDECIDALNDFTKTKGIYKTEAVSLLKILSNKNQ